MKKFVFLMVILFLLAACGSPAGTQPPLNTGPVTATHVAVTGAPGPGAPRTRSGSRSATATSPASVNFRQCQEVEPGGENITPLASGNSGGIAAGNLGGTTTIVSSRIVGNTASSGSGMHKDLNNGTVTAINNWWGCNAGPGGTGCDTAILGGSGSGSNPTGAIVWAPMAANCCGMVGKLDFFGMSMVIGPKGEVLAEGGYEPAAVTATIDFREMVAWREQIPCFNDRKPECY